MKKDLDIKSIAKNIKLIILDVDGVLTNGELYFIAEGEFKAFNARDGLGMAIAKKAGLEFAIISGNNSKSVEQRLAKFNITNIHQGVEDKIIKYEQIKKDLGILDIEIAYMGDDLIDLPVMTKVGLPTTVANGDEFVREHSLWQSKSNGGEGAVRELCEFILEAKGLLSGIRNEYLLR